MEYGYLICAVFLIICLVDLVNHNKKVDELFPDDSNKQHWNMRLELKIRLYVFVLLLIFLIGFFVWSIIGG